MTRYAVPDVALQQPHCTEIIIRRSRFLAQCAHTPNPAAARAFVDQIRRQHADATHNCWAYAAGAPGDTAQIGSSDDGEPHGTAGRPMLQIVLHGGIGELCVVVSRWFGGVKLGTGGLVRAYQDSVRECLASLPVRQRVPECSLQLALGYAHVDALRRMLPTFEARLESEEYLADARLQLRLPQEHVQAFAVALAGISNGAAQCTVLEQETTD